MTQLNPSSHNQRSIIAATATIGTVGTAIGFGSQLISAMMVNHSVPYSIIGYNGMIGGIATITAAYFTPHIALKFGIAKPILIMLIIGSLSFIGFYCFQQLWIWFLLRFTLHFAMTILFILSEFWVNSSSPPDKRGVILAIYATILATGFALGPVIFSIVGSSGFFPFFVGSAISLLASFFILSSLNYSPKFKHRQSKPFLHYIVKIPTSTMAVFIFGAIQMGTITLIIPFSLNAGFSESEAGKFMTLLALGSVLLLVPISIMSDYMRDHRYMLSFCGIIGFAGSLALPFLLGSIFWLKATLFILGGVSAGLYTIGLAQLGACLTKNELAAANSAFIFCYGIGMLAGPALIGQAMDFFPILGFSITISLFFGLYVLLLICQMIVKFFRA